MSMEITIESELSGFNRLADHLFDSHDLRVMSHVRSDPLAIQVTSRETASVIPNHHAIWVEHRYNFEDIPIPKQLGSFLAAKKEIDNTFHDE
jgi:hypothetical protein